MGKSSSPPEKTSRVSLIETVQTPLGFFVLVVLIVEVILGISANFSEGADRTYLIFGMLGLIFLLVLIVAGMALFRPAALYGQAGRSEERLTAYSKNERKTLEIQVVKSPRILLGQSWPVDSSFQKDYFQEDVRIIRKAFPKSVTVVQQLTATKLRELLTDNKFDIVQLTINITTDWESGDVKLWFADGSFLPGGGFVKLLEISETKLVIIASCDSVPLAAKLATRVNMIAASGLLPVQAFSQWQQVFYKLLSQGFPLSRAYSVATSSVKIPMAMIMKQDVAFGELKSKDEAAA